MAVKSKVVIMPKFITKEFPDYRLVPKNVEYDVPVPVKKEVPFEVKVPEIVKVKKEIEVEKVKVVEKPYEVKVPKLVSYNLPSFTAEEVARIKQAVEMLPKVLDMLGKIVKFVPKEVFFDVKVPKVKEEPYPVSVPDYKSITILRPHFQDVKVLHPIIVEEIMSLEEWNKKSKKEKEKIAEIIKSQRVK